MNTKQEQFSYVSEVKSDASSVRSTVLPALGPDNVGDVAEAPCFHDFQTIRQKRIGHPQIEMGARRKDPLYSNGFNIVQCHC